MYVCVYIYIYTYICIHIYMYIYIYMTIYVSTRASHTFTQFTQTTHSNARLIGRKLQNNYQKNNYFKGDAITCIQHRPIHNQKRRIYLPWRPKCICKRDPFMFAKETRMTRITAVLSELLGGNCKPSMIAIMCIQKWRIHMQKNPHICKRNLDVCAMKYQQRLV